MIPMDREVDELAEVYSPQQLQQKYKVTQELMYLLALQKVQSDMKAAQNQLTMSQQQQPGTIKDQMEGRVFQEKLRQVSGTIAQQEAQRRQQQPQQPRPQQRMMASGGIVGFTKGGEVTDEQLQRYGYTREQFNLLPDNQKTDLLNRIATRGRLTRPFKAIGEAASGIASGIGAIGSAITGVQKEEEQAAPTSVAPSQSYEERLESYKDKLPGGVEEKPPVDPADLDAAKTAQAKRVQQNMQSYEAQRGSGVGGGAAPTKTSPFTKPDSVMELLPEGLKDSLTSAAGMGPEGIAAAAEEARLRAEKVAGRADKAQKFERMREEQETLYNELQDPDKQQAQMRRNIFAAFGRGGNSFGQLMGNALTAISKTEAGQDQLKQLALSKKQGVDTLAMEVDVKIADQTNQSINAAINAARADKRQAMDTLSNLTAEDLRQNRQFLRDQFDFEDRTAQRALQRADLASKNADREITRDMTNLRYIINSINEIRGTRKEALVDILSTNQRYLQLKIAERQGKLDEEEAEELNLLKKSVELYIYEELEVSDEILNRLVEQAESLQGKQYVTPDEIEAVR
jgi:hypothetical protein